MLRIINRVLAFGVATLVAAALFVTGVAIWSWWEPAAPQVGDAPGSSPAPTGQAPIPSTPPLR
ncbi:MAG: hypothetical protein CL482_08345 [Acidobacteria bacterium]|nr:hypothetical protein [Acidobacteriota bacterium]MEE2962858.1 hypothetical protein [Acidobacteriota bacterium]